jgi:hypothetical protein
LDNGRSLPLLNQKSGTDDQHNDEQVYEEGKLDSEA